VIILCSFWGVNGSGLCNEGSYYYEGNAMCKNTDDVDDIGSDLNQSSGSGVPSEARTWGIFCHLSSLSGFIGMPFGSILGPLICWLVKKDEFEFVNDQGKESLNFQINIFLWFVVSVVLCFVLIGVILIPLVIILKIVFVIIASVKASNGEYYRYPCIIRFIM